MKAFIATFLLVLLASAQSMAQCAMCKAVAESGIDDNGNGVAAGLNIGIIFIMGIPYMLLSIVILVFFRKRFIGFWKSFSQIHSS